MAAVLVTHHGPHMSPLTISPREDCGSGETGSNLESVLIAVTVKKRISLYFGRTLFWVFSFVHKIVLFGAFPRAKNRALDRAFWCSPSCTKSCFLVLSLVPKIVLFGALPRAKNRALDRAFWCSPSCQKSCFLVLSFVHCSPLSKHRALDRAFWCSPSCQKSCSRSCSLLQLLGLCQYILICYKYCACDVVECNVAFYHVQTLFINYRLCAIYIIGINWS